MVRALDNLSSQELGVSAAPVGVFTSPDGQSIGYFDSLQGTLKRIAISGGAPITIVGEPMNAMRGATWGEDGTIIYADSSPTTGLFSVPSTGGAPKLLTKVDRARGEGDHVFPQFLPGGNAVLFTIVPGSGEFENAQIVALDLRTSALKVILRGGMDARYVPSGHLVYAVSGALRAVAFDLQRLDVIGTSVPVIDAVETRLPFPAQVAIAANGTVVYVRGGANVTGKRTLVWVNRSGKEEVIAGLEPRAYQRPRLSRDGTRVALETTDQEHDIWIWDLRTRNLRRLTIDPGPDTYPVWTPDDRVIYGSLGRGAAQNVYSRAADGSGIVEQLTRGERSIQPQAIRPDGSGVIVRAAGGSTRFDLLLLPLRPPGPERPLVATPEDEVGAELSPDGRWLAYQTTTSGPQIVVRPFPNVDEGYWQVSTGGGRMPMWSRNGRELFYLAPENTLMGVRVESDQSFQFTPAVPVLRGQYYYPGGPNSRTFDISPDGQRFLMLKEVQSDDAPLDLIVVQNWFEELKQRVPVP